VFKKWKFWGGGGLMPNSLCGGVMDIFWNHTLSILHGEGKSYCFTVSCVPESTVYI